MRSVHKTHSIYTLIPIILICIQTKYIFHSLGYIRYEDLAESVRNPFWLNYHTIYDGTSSNVGWYGTMLFLYKTIGFDLFTARYYRIFIYSLFIFLLYKQLTRQFGQKPSIIPLVAIGISPTLLYLNTFQAAYGLDVQYFVIISSLILSLKKPNRKYFLKILCAGSMAMWSAMTYPAFFFLIPGLTLMTLFKLRSLLLSKKQWLQSIVIGLVGFALPFMLALGYMSNPSRLLHDKQGGQGIFRGSGRLVTNVGQFWLNVQDNIADYFVKGITAQFELVHVEFSNLYPIIAFGLMLFISKNIYFKNKQYRPYVLVFATVFFTSFIGSSMSSRGMRTNAPALVGIYGLFSLSWITTYTSKKIPKIKRQLILGILLLIPVHHILVFWQNYQFIGQPSEVSYQLDYTKNTPDKQLAKHINEVQKKPLTLACIANNGQYYHCRYQEVYAAVAGTCVWNHLSCNPIFGYDTKTNQYVELDPILWLSYYWVH